MNAIQAKWPRLSLRSTNLLLAFTITAASVQAARLQELNGSSTEDITRLRVFEEPLTPIGGQPTPNENAALVAGLQKYSQRQTADDFSALTSFLAGHTNSPWAASLLTVLGTEYYNAAYYSRALDAWGRAWTLAKDATDVPAKSLADRALAQLAGLYSRLGRMGELEVLLKSVESRVILGSSGEKISGAREALWTMQHRPEVAFRCGPLALRCIKLGTNPTGPGDMEIYNSESSTNGFSLTQVAELSEKVGMGYQMAFREKGGELVVPSVVHWKVGHYAALVRREGERFLLEDPTFGNTVWASRNALDAECSGYFLLPPGPLPKDWRAVKPEEGRRVFGKGVTTVSDDQNHGCKDLQSGGSDSCQDKSCVGMAVASVHLMLVNLNLSDQPVGYTPPIGPAVNFTVRYNHREAYQPANFTYANFGPKWTCDWISYITDNPQSLSADARYYIRGGGTRTFSSFDSTKQSFAPQQYDQTRLTRTSAASYEMRSRDGSKMVFGRSDGSIGTSRKIFLTQVVDAFGNIVNLQYDNNLRLTNITDAIGQSTTITYGLTNDLFKITKVTDPFGRFASFDYDEVGRLTNITDVIGLKSQFVYQTNSDFVSRLITPYGPTEFIRGNQGTTRWLETLFPDGSRERVEFNQNTNGIAFSDPPEKVPQGMNVFNLWLHGRNTFYWSRNASSQGYGDYSKAQIYHWLHGADITSASGILESSKLALEGRVWFSYEGQVPPYSSAGKNNQPTVVGRVLDDGTTQLQRYAFNEFGRMTNTIDPLGRQFSYLYSSNGIDLLEVRQTRGTNNEMLSRTTYNAQHLPLTQTDAAKQTSTNTYNAQGQLLTSTNPKGETTTYQYNTNGYLMVVDPPLPGTNDNLVLTYDGFGRLRSRWDEAGGLLTFDYDALDRMTNITFPDATYQQLIYDRLDPVSIRDRAGRQTFMEYDSRRQMIKRTDAMGRETRMEWCTCGDLSSIIDPMGRATTWIKDVQNRPYAKQFSDGSRILYFYENTTSRLRQIVDEKKQVTNFTYNKDDTLRSISYANTENPMTNVGYAYDPNYRRVTAITEGAATTAYSYYPITDAPTLGAGQLASENGPLADDTVTYGYDPLGRQLLKSLNGFGSLASFDALGRLAFETNLLGNFTNLYAGTSARLTMKTFPNGQTLERTYQGVLENFALQKISHKLGVTPISEFSYERDPEANRITAWFQQSGAQAPETHALSYDDENQLLSDVVTNHTGLLNRYTYSYDSAGNRLLEQTGNSTNVMVYNSLNQISAASEPFGARTNEWDARNRLVAVNQGSMRAEFAYDFKDRLISIRHLTNSVTATFRRFVWCDNEIAEERDFSGAVTKRFYRQGVKLETGLAAGRYYYTQDHLGSIREVTDASGVVRARYDYDPYGRRSQLSGDIEADFGFTGIFWSNETDLGFARFRVYDPHLGRWLSRDPLPDAEWEQGPNLYSYVRSNPVNLTDRSGLAPDLSCCDALLERFHKIHSEGLEKCEMDRMKARVECEFGFDVPDDISVRDFIDLADKYKRDCEYWRTVASISCDTYDSQSDSAFWDYYACKQKGCKPVKCKPKKKSQKPTVLPARGGV